MNMISWMTFSAALIYWLVLAFMMTLFILRIRAIFSRPRTLSYGEKRSNGTVEITSMKNWLLFKYLAAII